jgi:small subunit ribosomal protein S6
MNYYEKIVILDPNIDDTAVEETVQRIKDVIIKEGGEIFKTDNWGRRKMAYELNKHKKGNYILLLFQAPPPTILQIEKLCKVIDSIIKFMIVKLTNKKQIAAVTASLAKAAVEATADKTGAAEEKPAEAVETTEAAPQPEETKDV